MVARVAATRVVSIEVLITLVLQSQLQYKRRKILIGEDSRHALRRCPTLIADVSWDLSHKPEEQFVAAIRSGRQLPNPVVKICQ